MSNWSLIGEFTEIESGNRNERPELAKALALCKRQKAKLVIAKLDRLSRNLAFIATLMDSGVEFVAANEVLTNVRNLFQDSDHEQQSIDVNSLTVEALQSLQAELNDHGVKTDVKLASELPHIIGHRVQLQEVILNLVHNAIDAMASVKVDNRALRVRTKSDGDKAVIVEVEDSGQGIEPQRLVSIFEPFVTTKPKGSGLGLAICSRIIERHGGRLTACSDGTNGALFKIVLPVQLTAPVPLAPDLQT